MKKFFVFMSVTALTLVSCVKTQVVYTGGLAPREIAFSPLAQNATKTTTFPETESFYLAAYAVGASGYDYFDKTVFSYNSGTWKGGQYWPVDAVTLNFLAVTKQGDNPTVSFGTGTPRANFASQVAVTLSNNTPVNGAQHDLMFAYNRSSDKTEPVELAFSHALSWVYFTVKSNVGSALTVTGITLDGATYSGVATIGLTNYDSSTETLSHSLDWSPGSPQNNVAVPGISSVSVTTTASSCGSGLMIVPSNTAFTSFTIQYTLNDHSYSKVITPESTELTAGRKYTYDISISLTEITVSASVSEWANGGTINS